MSQYTIPDISDLAEETDRWCRSGRHPMLTGELRTMQRDLMLLARDATAAACRISALIRTAETEATIKVLAQELDDKGDVK